MKIIAFYPGDYPNGAAPMSYRLHYYLKALQSKGVEVEIVIPSASKNLSGVFEGIPYSHVNSIQPTRFNQNTIKRNYANICGKLAKNCDVIFTTIPSKHIAKAVHKNGGKIAIEINENPYSIIARRLNTKLELHIRRCIFLHKTLKSFDGIITISHSLLDLITEHKNKTAHVIRIPILTGQKEIHRNPTTSNVPFILHAGALSEQKDGIKAMFRAFSIAHKKLDGRVQFIFTNKTGFPSLIRWIDNFIKMNNLQNCIVFKGIQPKEELEKLYNDCSLAILNKPVNEQNNFNFPTKLTELLPRDIPVIISNTAELKYFFTDNENAFMFEPNDYRQLAEKIIFIIKNPDKVINTTKNARMLAIKEFYYLNFSGDLYSFFTNICATRSEN